MCYCIYILSKIRENTLFLGYAIDRHEPTRTDTYSNTGAVSLSRCFDVSESDVLSSCKAAVIKSFDQSDVLQSVNVDTRQVVGDSMTTRYRIHLFVEGRTRKGHQFLNLVYFLIFMSCCTAILGTVRVLSNLGENFNHIPQILLIYLYHSRVREYFNRIPRTH